MRVLFTLLPALGSLQPLIPLAQALAAGGHQVAWCSAASFRADTEETGFPFFSAGLDFHVSRPDFIETLCAAAGVSPPPAGSQPSRAAWDEMRRERGSWVVRELFAGVVARRMAPDIITIARTWGADLIVRESLDFAGCAAAEVLGLPHASVGAEAGSAVDRRVQLAASLAALRKAVGLPEDPTGAMLYRYLHLCFCPPAFDGVDAPFPPNTHFVQHRNPPRPRERLPSWFGELPPRPIVLATLGTVFHRTPGVFEAIVQALRDEPITLIAGLGRDQDPARLGSQPPHVHLERYVQQTLLLPHCAAFITHGGFNSVKEAMSFGIPMVVIPMMGDQVYCAARCRALGMAEVVELEERTTDRIREAVRAILSTPSYRSAAQAMRRQMEALSDLNRAISLLETLERERRPLIRAGPRVAAE
jgi:UDP:flavonoid glycosyltransferase YjiC (YdhE family)